MDLNSTPFLFFFFPFVALLYLAAPGSRGKNLLLALASLVFYAFGDLRGIVILLLAFAVNFVVSRVIARNRGNKALLAVILVADIAVLVYYKYLDLLLSTFGGSLGLAPRNILAPVGISFFLFKAMSYCIDVARGTEPGGFLDVLLYISFFPQITSGPITRFPQFRESLGRAHADAEQMALGLRRFIVGLGKKLLVAGPVAAIADGAFGLGGEAGAGLCWLGAVSYTVQLYFDFSGYSDMAIGLGGMFGIVTPENFNYPYIAISLRDFWKRWHISLSSWLQDYLYIPLGGGRKGKTRKGINQFVVFLVSGIWHGANWTFLAWGAWHGIWNAVETFAAEPLKKLRASAPGRAVCHLYTMVLVCVGFVFFRAPSISTAFAMLGAMFTFAAPSGQAVLALESFAPAAWLALAAGIAGSLPLVPWGKERLGTKASWARPLSLVCALALLAVCMLAAAGGNFQPFIYTQF